MPRRHTCLLAGTSPPPSLPTSSPAPRAAPGVCGRCAGALYRTGRTARPSGPNSSTPGRRRIGGKPAFRSLVERRRALVPVSGFYEWRRPGPENGDGKQPFYFHRPDGAPLVFAGLWDLWVDAEWRPLRSFTVITTAANKTMAPVHHRMPAVLFPEDWDEWLHPGPLRTGRLADLLVPAPEEALVAYRVGNGVNKSANDGPELIEPAAVQQQALGLAYNRHCSPWPTRPEKRAHPQQPSR